MVRTTLVALSLMLVAACGSTSSGPPTSAAPPNPPTPPASSGADPCTLVTRDEAASAMKVSAGTVSGPTQQPGGLPGQKTCAFNSQGAALVTVSVIPNATQSLFGQFQAASKASTNYQSETGLGDAAYRDAGMLDVLKGSVILQIFLSGMGSSAAEVDGPLRTLAQAALSRLPA